ncbi:MAG: hypothetical protein HYS22_05315 [Deltaproteobacteria bacterium]|nr:hypothetical protein [Deltaproteobacteria bacterium]
MKKTGFLFFLLLFFAPPLWGFGSVNVPVDHPVYRDIDRLIAFGLIHEAIYGQRPWSRREISRMIEEALKNDEENQQQGAAPILGRLKKEYHEELVQRGALEGEKDFNTLHFLETSRFSFTYFDSPVRAVPRDNGVGAFIEADINPLIANREGRYFANGETLSLETSHRAQIGPHLAINLRPDFRVLIEKEGKNRPKFFLQNFYGRLEFGNFVTEIGRDSLILGQGEYGGHLLSNNARPLDMIHFSNDSPLYNPWLFKYLGPTRYSFFVATMGPEREFPYTLLVGLKISIRPWSFFEFGISNIFFMGGQGAPGLNFLDPISEIFLVRTGNKVTKNVADHRGGLDLRITIPPLRNSALYGEVMFDDLGFEILGGDPTYYEDRAAYLAGFYIPAIDPEGKLSLRIEYEHTDPLFYRHGVWNFGHTLNRHILGSELGPDGDKFHIKTVWDLRQTSQLDFVFDWELRDSDIYTSGDGDYFRDKNGPPEKRYRVVTGWTEKFGERIELAGNFGYERVTGFNFVPGVDRNNFLGEISFLFKWD